MPQRNGLSLLTAAAFAATLLSAQSISVTPANESVVTGGSKQFTAAVTGLATSSVNWAVNGVPGGSAATGTIDAMHAPSAMLSVALRRALPLIPFSPR